MESCSIPGRGQRFCVSPKRFGPTQLPIELVPGAHYRWQISWSVRRTVHLHLEPRLKKCGGLSFLPPIHCVVQRDTFTVFLVNLYHVCLSVNQGACYAIISVTTVYGFAQSHEQYVK
jgi:hypothetical protein